MSTMLKAHSTASCSSHASSSSSSRRLHPDDRVSHTQRPRKHSSASSRSYSPYPLTPPQSVRELHNPSPSQRWDDDMPNAPAPLSDILKAFKESGDGDREMLLAILNAKRAEEERITTLMQTRLAFLHAHVQSQHSSSVPSILHSPYPGPGTGAAPVPLTIPHEREFGSGSAHGLELLLSAGRARESDERSR